MGVLNQIHPPSSPSLTRIISSSSLTSSTQEPQHPGPNHISFPQPQPGRSPDGSPCMYPTISRPEHKPICQDWDTRPLLAHQPTLQLLGRQMAPPMVEKPELPMAREVSTTQQEQEMLEKLVATSVPTALDPVSAEQQKERPRTKPRPEKPADHHSSPHNSPPATPTPHPQSSAPPSPHSPSETPTPSH